MSAKPCYLLLQIRDQDDPMRFHEIRCFARVLDCEPEDMEIFDLLQAKPLGGLMEKVDVLLLGGSGDYSVSKGGSWLERALDTMRLIHACSKPTFASCWGFQAMAKALGGEVVTDLSRAEVGTYELSLSAEGLSDPVFGDLGTSFLAQMGHQDIVTALPEDAVLLASSSRVHNEAFFFRSKPIYCTQFHAELNRDDILIRVRKYPEYVKKIRGLTLEQFDRTVKETPRAELLVKRFINHVLS